MTITLTARELNDLIAAAVAVAERMTPEERAAMMEAQRQSWARGEAGLRETSASPPRVPVTAEEIGDASQAKWQRKHGVESGPGQPMTDICERLEADATTLDSLSDPWGMSSAALEREAAAEIRRLRSDIAAMNDFVDRTLDDLSTVRADGEARYRAGIEAAAKAVDNCVIQGDANTLDNDVRRIAYDYAAYCKSTHLVAIRALADAPKSEGE